MKCLKCNRWASQSIVIGEVTYYFCSNTKIKKNYIRNNIINLKQDGFVITGCKKEMAETIKTKKGN